MAMLPTHDPGLTLLSFSLALGVSITLLLCSIFMLWRNHKVYRFRSTLIDRVSALAQADIDAGRDWHWRYDVLTAVTYEAMMHRFWRPLTVEAFYADAKFLS